MSAKGSLKVYKEGPLLVFERIPQGGVVRYDFATKTAYGLSGQPVKNVKRQLASYTIKDMIDGCEDDRYANYLRFIANCAGNGGEITNIGTMLDYVPQYSRYEQYFSAGLKRVNTSVGNYRFDEVPTNVIRICRQYDLPLVYSLVAGYKQDPNGYSLAFNLPYISLTPNDVFGLLTMNHSDRNGYCLDVLEFIKTYGYTMKSFMLYIDRMETFEALKPMNAFSILRDTCSMMRAISPRFDHYPRNLKTTHDIVMRNYQRMKMSFDEVAFQTRVKEEMEKSIGAFAFIYPRSTQDIKDEAVQQNNCVASYIDRVIDGKCDILFLRDAKQPEHSLVTLEVVDGKVVQARQAYNTPITPEQKAVIDQWEEWYQSRKAG